MASVFLFWTYILFYILVQVSLQQQAKDVKELPSSGRPTQLPKPPPKLPKTKVDGTTEKRGLKHASPVVTQKLGQSAGTKGEESKTLATHELSVVRFFWQHYVPWYCIWQLCFECVICVRDNTVGGWCASSVCLYTADLLNWNFSYIIFIKSIWESYSVITSKCVSSVCLSKFNYNNSY